MMLLIIAVWIILLAEKIVQWIKRNLYVITAAMIPAAIMIAWIWAAAHIRMG